MRGFFSRLEFYRDYFRSRYDADVEVAKELMKMPFPLDLEDGTILYCLETITCNKTDYCIVIQDNKGFTNKF